MAGECTMFRVYTNAEGKMRVHNDLPEDGYALHCLVGLLTREIHHLCDILNNEDSEPAGDEELGDMHNLLDGEAPE